MSIYETFFPASKTRKGVGISGIHRSGKTSLAKGELAPNNDKFLLHGFKSLNYVDLKTANLADSLGLVSAKHMSVEDRMLFQDALFKQYLYLLSRRKDQWCTDRTFLDLIAYTLSDPNVEKVDAKWLEGYVKKCVTAQRNLYRHTYLLLTQIPHVEETDKFIGVQNLAYNTKYQAIILGIANAYDLPYTRLT